MGLWVNGESHCTSIVNWGFDADDTYLREALGEEHAMVEEVAGRSLEGKEHVEDLVCAVCCADAYCHWVDERQAFSGCGCRHSVGRPSKTADNEHTRQIAF